MAASEDDKSIPEGWRLRLELLRDRRSFAHGMGGEEKLARRSARGRLNARQLVELFCDRGSFCEIGALSGGVSFHGEALAAADALVGGYASVDGRPVIFGVEDFTVMGGSIGPGTNAKKLRLAMMAERERKPYIMFLDGAGERMSNARERRSYAPNDMQILGRLSGKVPTVAVVIGSSAGHGAITGLLMDFVIMLRDSSIFAAGPPLVEMATGEKTTKEVLGGAEMHTSHSGVAHNLVEDEQAACQLVRHWLRLLPANAWELPPHSEEHPEQRGERELPEVLQLLPDDPMQPYDMRRIILQLIDRTEEWLEFQPQYGTTLITGMARLGGYSVGIVANQPTVQAGAITWQAANKGAHFLDICNNYHLPVIFLADNPGVMTGTVAERDGTLRASARMFAAQCRLRGPKLHLTLRKAFGFGSSLMGMNPFDEQTASFALPGIALGAMPAAGGSKAAKLSPEEARAAVETQAESTWTTADNLAYDDIIDPRQMRNVLLRSLLLFPQRGHTLGPAGGVGR